MDKVSEQATEGATERERESEALVVLHKSFWHGSLAVRQQSAHHAMSPLAEQCLTTQT